MSSPSPPKRSKYSYCDPDFLIKLQKTVEKADGSTSPRKKCRLPPQDLLSYGSDVNVNINLNRPVPPSQGSAPRSTLTACAGDVNCDSEHLRQTPLHENDAVRVRMDTDALARLLTNEGGDINCPQLPGDCDPLLLDEARHRFTINAALITFGSDTNRVEGQFWNLQFLTNFEQFQGQSQLKGGLCEPQRLVLKALLSTGSEVNSTRFKGTQQQGFVPSKNDNGPQRMAHLLVTYGQKVNSICSE